MEKANTDKQNNNNKTSVTPEIATFCGVRGYEKGGVAYLHIEDMARGLGFTIIRESGNVNVRWSRVEAYLRDLGFIRPAESAGKTFNYYIPEDICYGLCAKAKNEKAAAFRIKVVDEIIPAIHKASKYEVKPTDYKPSVHGGLTTTLNLLSTIIQEKEEISLNIQRIIRDLHEHGVDEYMLGILQEEADNAFEAIHNFEEACIRALADDESYKQL